MAADYLAAKKDDELVHTSWLADFVGGVVKGAIYAGIGLAAAALTVGTGGLAGFAMATAVGLGAGFILGEAIDAIADFSSGLVDSALSFFGMKGPPEGIITSGSPNVLTKSKQAARAAGSVPDIIIQGELAQEAENPPDGKAWSIIKGIAKKTLMVGGGLLALSNPVMGAAALTGLILSRNNKAAPLPEEGPQPVPSPKQGFWEGLIAPVAQAKHPYATAKDQDTISCTKWHPFHGPDFYLAEGSKKVLINSQPACRNGDRSTCEAKISHQHGSPQVCIGGGSLVVRDIKSGKNPLAAFLGEVVGSVLVAALSTGLRKCAADIPCMLFREALGSAAGGIVGGLIGEGLSRLISLGSPVYLATGAKVLSGDEDQDFILDGHIPLIWQRVYSSRNSRTGMMGLGWALPFEVSLTLQYSATHPDEIEAIYTDMSGRELRLGCLALGQSVYYPDEGFRIYRTLQNLFILETDEGIYQQFEADPLRMDRLRLAALYDRHQNGLYLRYNPQGRVSHIFDDKKAIDVRLEYDLSMGRLQAVYQCSTEHNERQLVQYQYNAGGELIAVINADGCCSRRFAYDPVHHLMVMHQQASGLQAHYHWQQQQFIRPGPGAEGCEREWYVTQHWLEAENKRLDEYFFDYDVNRRTVSVRQTGIGHSWRKWNAQHQMTDYINELGEHWQLRWNDTRQLLGLTDPQGGEYRFEYDERGNLIIEVDPAGQKILTNWDTDFKLPLSTIRPNGAAWYHQYNQWGDLIKTIDPQQGISRYQYDEQGKLTGAEDAAGNRYQYYYDLYGRLNRQRDCSGYETSLSYDEWGRVQRLRDAEGGTTAYGLSASGRLETVTLPDGRRKAYHYNRQGELVKLTDAGGEETVLSYNSRGQVTRRIDPQGLTLHYDYDRLGRLRRLRNEQDEAYEFEYDALNRLVKESGLSGQVKQYRYNRLGCVSRLTHHPDNGGKPQVSCFSYDAIGRLVVKLSHDYRTEYRYRDDGLEIKRYHRRQWRAAQREKRPTVEFECLRFEQDLFGAVTAEHNHGGCYRHSYDKLGNLIDSELPDGRHLRMLHYGSGHLQQLNLDNQVIAEYERDRLHREVKRSQGGLAQQTAYDAAGRIISRITGRHGASLIATPQIERQYRYDNQDNLISQRVNYGIDSKAFSYGRRKDEDYRYDLSGRLTGSRHHGLEESYYYDDASNRVTGSIDRAKHNRLEVLERYRYRYDGFGRLVWRNIPQSGGEQRFEYDSEQRLRRVLFSGHRDYERADYDYDSLGRRTEKRLYRHGESEAETTVYYWSGMRLCGESGSRHCNHDVLYLYNESGYEPLARVDRVRLGEKCQQQIYYYHNRLNGLPEALSNESGTLVWQGDYSVWGRSRGEQSQLPALTEQNLRFAGQYFDRETGLHYNTLRYYDPDGGRFTQQDPIGLMGGLNLYQYAPNPVGWVDPWGLCSVKLSKNMEDAGTARPKDSAAHHIVGDTSQKAQPARDILAKHGIGVDDAVNGVFLPNKNNTGNLSGIIHNGKHPNDYFKAVNDRIRNADLLGGKQGVLAELDNIRNILSSASNNSSWYNIL